MSRNVKPLFYFMSIFCRAYAAFPASAPHTCGYFLPCPARKGGKHTARTQKGGARKTARAARAPRTPPSRYSISMRCSSSFLATSFGMLTCRMPFSYFALISSRLISPT